MVETIRYSLIGKEDLALGFGTFPVTLADGRVVTLRRIDVGSILNDPLVSSFPYTRMDGYGGIVNVQNPLYGAKADGVTDDTAAINAARTAAISNGSTLLFPPGTYAIDQLTGWPGGTVFAHGATILHNGDSKPLLNLYDATPTTITLFRWFGGTLKAKQSAVNPTSALIYGRNLTRSFVQDVVLQGGTADDSTKYAVRGIHLDGTAGAGNGVYEVNVTNAVIRGCSGNGVDLDGWDGAAARVNNNTFVNPLVLNNGGNGWNHDGQGTAIHGGDTEGNTGVGHYLDDHGTYYAMGSWTESNTGGNFDVSGTGAMANYSVYIGASGTTPSTTIRAYYLAWIARTASFGFGIDVQHGAVDSYRSVVGNRAFGAFVDGDTVPRGQMLADGSIRWGAGGASAVDLILERLAANSLGIGAGDRLDLNTRSNVLMLQKIATADLPAAGAGAEGQICIEDAGAGDRNLIIWAGGQRFRIDGGAAF